MWEKRVAPLSGVAAVVLMALSVVITGYYEFMPEPDRIVTFYSDSPTRLMTGAYIGVLASFFLLWFAGSLRDGIRSRGEGNDRYALISFGGAVFASAMIVLGMISISYPAERVMMHGSIDAGTATMFFDLSSGLMGTAFPIGVAAIIGGYGLAQLRDSTSPAWRAWGSLVIALGLVSPLNWVVIGLGILWLVVVGLAMYRAGSSAVALETVGA